MVLLALEAAGLALLLALSAFLSGSETALFGLKPWQVPRAAPGNSRDRVVEHLLEDPALLLVGLILANECVNVTISFISSGLSARYLHGRAGMALGVAATTALIVLIGEALPKAVSARFPLGVARAYGPALHRLLGLIRAPSRLLLSLLARLGGSDRGPHRDSIDELRLLLHAARTEGSFRREEERFLTRILALLHEPASSRMIPRTAMAFLEEGLAPAELLSRARSSACDWLVVQGRTPDEVRGVVSRQDVLEWSMAEGAPTSQPRPRPVPYHPEGRPLRQVFLDLFEREHPVVILADEYGGVAGMVTRDSLAAALLFPGDRTPVTGEDMVLPGAMPYSEFLERYHRASPDPRCKTLAGHVLNLAGRVPSPGDSFQDAGMRYAVREATSRQVLSVAVSLLEPGAGEP